MSWVVYIPVMGKGGESWIYLFDKSGEMLIFDTHEAAEQAASQYKHHRILEYTIEQNI